MTYPQTSPNLPTYTIVSPSGVTIAFNTGPDTDGVEWVLHTLDGWDNPDVREDLTARAVNHGLYAGAFFYDGRPMTATGFVKTPTLALHLSSRDKLLSAIDTPHAPGLLLVNETPARQVEFRRAGRVGIARRRPTVFEYDLALIAPDPRRYSQTLTTVTVGTSATAVTAGGTFRDGTPMRLLITPTTTGSGTTGSVTESTTGSVFSITGHRQVLLDSVAQTVTFTDDGTPAWSVVDNTQDLFFNLQPGVTYSFARTVGLAATLTYRDAWI